MPIYLVNICLAIVITIDISSFYLTILPWFITIISGIFSFYMTTLKWFVTMMHPFTALARIMTTLAFRCTGLLHDGKH